MRTDASFIESQDKLSLAAYVRGTTKQSVAIAIKPGQMENLSKLDADQKQQQRDHMRQKFCVHYSETQEKKTNETQANGNVKTKEELATPKLSDPPDSW